MRKSERLLFFAMGWIAKKIKITFGGRENRAGFVVRRVNENQELPVRCEAVKWTEDVYCR
jgi:hypothetical protein